MLDFILTYLLFSINNYNTYKIVKEKQHKKKEKHSGNELQY